MKKILIILSVILLSFINLTSLNAVYINANGGTIHFYSQETGPGSWTGQASCSSGESCTVDFPSSGARSFLFVPNIIPELVVGNIYDLEFTFGIYAKQVLSYPELQISNVFVLDTEIQSYSVTYPSWNKATIKIKFKVTQNINSLYFGAGWVSSYTNVLGVDQNLMFAVDQDSIIVQEQQKTNEKLDELNKTQQETNNKLDDLNDNLTDDDVDTSGANSFFDSFNNQDHGGLSSIITAPISSLNKITATCQPINIDVWEKDVTLPCGDTLFWNKPEVQTFRVIWNILLGGPILYALLVKLYKTIEGLKNPDDDRIEVAKL